MPYLHTIRVSASRSMDTDIGHIPVEVLMSVKKTVGQKSMANT